MTLDPFGAAQAFLDAVVAAWTGQTLPKVQYVAEGGNVPWDGPQLTVALGGISPGLPAMSAGMPSRPPRAFPMTISLTVELVRDRKAGLTRQGGRQTALPTKAEDVKAGQASGADVTAMLECLLKIRENGSLVSHPTKLGITAVRPTGPQGDLLGVQGVVTVLLGHR